MQHMNGVEQAKILPAAIAEVKPIRQLIKAADVARRLGVSVSWVVQHASGKRRPYLPAVKMGTGRSPLRFDPLDVEKFIDDCRRIAGYRAEYARRYGSTRRLLERIGNRLTKIVSLLCDLDTSEK